MQPKNVTHDSDQKIADVLEAAADGMPSLHLAGRTYAPREIAAVIRSRITATEWFWMVKRMLSDAEREYEAVDAQLTPMLDDLRRVATVVFGPGHAAAEVLRTRQLPVTVSAAREAYSRAARRGWASRRARAKANGRA